MPAILKKALSLLTGSPAADPGLEMPKKSKRPLKKLTERQLIQMESEIGRELFGPIAKGHTREFFNLDKNTWIWYEEFTDAKTGKKHSTTTRYEVHENGILKAQDGAEYSFVEGEELENLTLAVQMYYEKVMRGIYNRDPVTGRELG